MTDPAIGQVIDGRYEVEAVIGRGGMGTVVRARHRFTGVQVALKVLRDDLGAAADLDQRFLAEARAASVIGHPAIVVVNDANRTPTGQLYLAMELLVGRPLRVAMIQGLSGDDVQRIGLELLDALAAAHARGFVHRDLKPENIFLLATTGAVKVLDFGIAKVLGLTDGRTGRGMVLGTLEYMAPEQLVDASTVDARADLWAAGIVLYEMITGLRPFPGATQDCSESLTCLTNCAMDGRCRCGCIHEMKPSSATLMARLYTCRTEVASDNDLFLKKCSGYANRCFADVP